MAAISTLMGFGALCTAEHGILRSAGVTSILGIGFALAGAFLILPPLLKSLFTHRTRSASGSTGDRVNARYSLIEAYPRVFARFKLRMDPMFAELPGLLPPPEAVCTVLDIGSGFGVPACWLAETFPKARIYGIEPAPGRVTVANRALDGQGVVVAGAAPTLPPTAEPADLAIMLDMVHYLSDDALARTAAGLLARLSPGGYLLVRAALPPVRQKTWTYHLESARLALAGTRPAYRQLDVLAEAFCKAGFVCEDRRPSGTAGDLAWLRCCKPRLPGSGT
jgi:SAM-dependent methyltransferase